MFLVLIILIQSCRVYHSKPIDIKEAVKTEKRVKVHTKDGRKLKFEKVILDSIQYYGLKNIKGGI